MKTKKKQSGIGKWIAIAVIVVVIVAIATGGSETEPQKVDTTNVADSTAEAEQTKETEEKEVKTSFLLGETAELNNVQVTMTNFEESIGEDFVLPADGNVFVLAEFEISNNTEREIAVSSMMSFEAYADDYALNYSASAIMLKDTQLDGAVAPGKKMKGWIGWEVPQDYKNIEIRFTDNVWNNGKFVFLYKK